MSERGKLRNSGFGVFSSSTHGIIHRIDWQLVFCWEDKAKIMEDIRPLFDGDEVFCFVVVENRGRKWGKCIVFFFCRSDLWHFFEIQVFGQNFV